MRPWTEETKERPQRSRMCDTGPDVRSGELSEGFVTSLRARTSRGRAEHAVRVPSVSRSNLEHLASTPPFGLERGYKCTKSCGRASSMYFREFFVVLCGCSVWLWCVSSYVPFCNMQHFRSAEHQNGSLPWGFHSKKGRLARFFKPITSMSRE